MTCIINYLYLIILSKLDYFSVTFINLQIKCYLKSWDSMKTLKHIHPGITSPGRTEERQPSPCHVHHYEGQMCEIQMGKMTYVVKG